MADTKSSRPAAIPEALMLARLEQSEQLREFFIQMWQQNPVLAKGAGARIKEILAPRQRGFTMVELVVTIVILGIVSAVVMPRFASLGAFDAAGYGDQVQALLRYAHKTAIAQRAVVAADAGTGGRCVIGSASGTTCDASSCAADPSWRAPIASTTVIGGTVFCFDSMGRPYASGASVETPATAMAATATVQVNDSGANIRSIRIEAETGYVH